MRKSSLSDQDRCVFAVYITVLPVSVLCCLSFVLDKDLSWNLNKAVCNAIDVPMVEVYSPDMLQKFLQGVLYGVYPKRD